MTHRERSKGHVKGIPGLEKDQPFRSFIRHMMNPASFEGGHEGDLWILLYSVICTYWQQTWLKWQETLYHRYKDWDTALTGCRLVPHVGIASSGYRLRHEVDACTRSGWRWYSIQKQMYTGIHFCPRSKCTLHMIGCLAQVKRPRRGWAISKVFFDKRFKFHEIQFSILFSKFGIWDH